MSEDGGAQFDVVKAANLRAHPVELTMLGLAIAEGDTGKSYDHPIFVESDAVTGLTLFDEGGVWTTQHSTPILY